MNHGEIVSFVWGVADLIRDTFTRGKYQDVILPLTVLRRKDEGGRMKEEDKESNPGDLKSRTQTCAHRAVRLYASLPKTTEVQVLGKQLLRAGTSVGAHCREGTRSRSDTEFVSKIEGGLRAGRGEVLDGTTPRGRDCPRRPARTTRPRG